MGSDYLQQLWAGLEERICTCGAGHSSNEAHHIGCEWLEYHSTVELLMAMRDAGYRILAPGEVDAETVEQCAKLIENGYDKPVGKPWRKDGKPSKNDECPHGRYMYEDCEPCAVIAIRALAGSKDKEGQR